MRTPGKSGGVFVLLVGALMVAASLPIAATTTRQMNLAEMCARADRIFRGMVVRATPGTVRVGTFDVPTITYRIRVDEAFKGEYASGTRERFVEVRMLGALKGPGAGDARTMTIVADLPSLEVNATYLLFTTRPSTIGMSTTVGLKQGLFRISGSDDEAPAVNGQNNQFLFRGMDPDGDRIRGPMAYGRLAQRVRALVRNGGGAR